MESITEVEEDCYSTCKTQSKNDISGGNYFLRSNSAQRDASPRKDRVRVSDFEKEGHCGKSASQQCQHDSCFEQFESREPSVRDTDSCRVSFGRTESGALQESHVFAGGEPLGRKRRDSKDTDHKLTDRRNVSNRPATQFLKKTGQASTPTPNRQKPCSVSALSLERLTGGSRSKSFSKLPSDTQSPLVLSCQAKAQGTAKGCFRSFREILQQRGLPPSKAPLKCVAPNDQINPRRTAVKELLFRRENRAPRSSPDLRHDFSGKGRLFLKIKLA